VYDGQWFLVKNNTDGELGRLYYIDGSTAIAIELELGKLKLTPTGNGNNTTNTGKLSWKQENGTAELGLYNDVNVGLGEDIFYYGKASANITKGQAVQFAGREGDHILIKPADVSEINANPKLILGIAKQAITSGDFGYVAHFGKIEGYDSGSFANGDLLWFASGGSTAGALTNVQPTAPNAKILMAAVIKVETSGAANNGVLQVRLTIEPKLSELQDVNINSIQDDHILRYNSANSRWENTADLTDVETDITEILNGTQIVGKAVNDQNGDEIDTTYLKVATASSTYVPLSSKGVPNGVAPLGADNKILSIHLPGGVDDIKEFADLASFPDPGEASIIYVALDTNKIYRWGGSSYVEISSSLALGTTNTTAFPGDRGLATETKTDNIVNGTQTLTDTRITNSAIGTIPLIVNAIANTTGNFTEWRDSAGIMRTGVESMGNLIAAGVRNFSNTNNAWVQTVSTGVVIRRNIADANPSLIVNQNNSSSTGDILRLQFAGANKLEITKDGFINQNGTRLFHQTGANTNTFFGLTAGNLTITGDANVSFGNNTLENATSAGSNVAVGLSALRFNTSGVSNVAVGRDGGRSNTSGNNNVFLGRDAGFNASQLATASNSAALGYQAYTDKSNQMVFGNASVSEFVFNRNTGALVLMPQTSISSATFPPLSVERTTANTAQIIGTTRLLATSSGDMADGFGPNFGFFIKDNAGVNNELGYVGIVRSGADNSGRVSLHTSNAGTITEKMTIMPDGKVGIGTASPSYSLTLVANTQGDGIQIRRNSNDNFAFANFGFRIATADSSNNFAEIRATRTNRAVGADTDLSFHTFSNSSLTERMRIRDDGLVGINETSPTAQLHVKSGATTRVPLIVDSLTSHATNLQEWKVNNSTQGLLTKEGRLSLIGGISHFIPGTAESDNRAYVNVSTNGTIISRNIADANPALITNLANSGSTANIQVWQKAGVAQSFINNTGVFVGQSRPESKEETGDYTLAIADEGKVLRANSSSNRTITIPLNSGTAIPIGAEIAIIRMGTGTVSISPTAGVTLNSVDNNRKIKDRYGSVALKKIATDEWVLAGSLEA
jgi:hypothetical protein